jgi:hypothetical protein
MSMGTIVPGRDDTASNRNSVVVGPAETLDEGRNASKAIVSFKQSIASAILSMTICIFNIPDGCKPLASDCIAHPVSAHHKPHVEPELIVKRRNAGRHNRGTGLLPWASIAQSITVAGQENM